MATPIPFDEATGRQFLKYARLLCARGYVHNTLGNIVMRVPHPDFPHGLAYTKHAELSLEEMELENIVVTDIPTSRVLLGGRTTSIGHNLSREILRLRPDIHATIHVHDDAMIAFLGSGAGGPRHHLAGAQPVGGLPSAQYPDRGSATQSRGRADCPEARHAAALPIAGGTGGDVRFAEAIIYPKRAETVMK